MNNLSHIVRRFNRFELKYITTLKKAEDIKNTLLAYLVPDENGFEHGHYGLASLYYDSPDYRCYWEKRDGVKYRRKLRIRQYEADGEISADTPVFLEIKQRVNRVTQKRRAVLPYREALHLCNDRLMPDCDQQDKAVIDEVYTYIWQYNLQPACIVRYKRHALIGTDYDMGLRVTFDTVLSCQAAPVYLHEHAFSRPMLPADRVVIEIKVNERIPYWLAELVAAKNLQLVRVSKYCLGVELTRNIPSTQLRLAGV